MQPSNKLEYPIEQLIAKLQALPPGTTYEEETTAFYGGETPNHTAGTSYQLQIDVVEGFNPPRLTLDEWSKEANIHVNAYKGDLKWVPDLINHPMRNALWHLADYYVTSVTGGGIWLSPSLAKFHPTPTNPMHQGWGLNNLPGNPDHEK